MGIMRACALLVCALVLLGVAHHANGQGQVSAVQGLLARFIPSQADKFILEITPVHNGTQNVTGFFVISGAVCPHTNTTGCISITGSDAVAVSSGVHHYLKYVANCSISWWGDQLDNLPKTGPLPQPPATISRETTYTFRYYFNVCTYGYSMFSWDWARWEREIDWMALNSINMPLAFNGQEYIFMEMYTTMFNLTFDEVNELFSGPALLPWNRMGNIQQWLGPLPPTWLEAQRDLQIQILARMRSFGMTPVLPAFSGLVPPAMRVKYPHANITLSSGWNGFPPTNFLEPMDPLFTAIQSAFLSIQERIYGTDHYYNCDLYNEMRPLSNSPTYLADSTAGVFNAMIAADPDATWVMQGWLFVSDPSFWQETQIKSLVHAVPHGRLIILDLYSEVVPVYNNTESYYGTPFIWNMLHNFGGRSGLYGRLPQVATWPAQALAANATNHSMFGLGLTPEAIETNPVVYDLMMENTWRGTEGVTNLDGWIAQYVTRRYAGSVPEPIYAAWKILQDTVYSCPTSQQGTSGSVFANYPTFNISKVSCCANASIYYDPNELEQALTLFIEGGAEAGSALTSQTTFQYDLVMLTAQVMSNLGLELHINASLAYSALDAQKFTANMEVFISVMSDMDPLMQTQELFLLGAWIHNATRWGANHTITNTQCNALRGVVPCGAPGILPDDCELLNCCYDNTGYYEPHCYYNNLTDVELLARNARTQITLWGPQGGTLTEYAYKLWSGLISSYYVPRWQQWTDAVSNVLSYGRGFDELKFLSDLQYFEEAWTRAADNPYPTAPSGNAYAIASTIYDKYFSASAKQRLQQ